MNKKEALEELTFDSSYIDEINEINSKSLIAIINNNIDELKNIHKNLIQLREDNDDMKNAKQPYQLAIEYFIKKMEK